MIHITINGAIDAKRLERAFQEALNRFVDYYGDNFTFFHEAQLVLFARDLNGEAICLLEPDALEFPAPFDAESTTDNEFYSDDDYEFDHEAYVKQQHERQIEQQKQRDEMMLLQSELDNQFTLIFSHLGDGIIDEFNNAIKKIWAEQKPIANNGKHKGQTSFMPFFEINNKLTRPLRLVTSSSNLRGKGILNPLYEATWKKILIPIHDTVIWRTHVLPELEKIMDAYHFAAVPTN